jgi:hypothetical protein
VANLISASRRTDIPRYYAPWFATRRRAGFAEYRTAFGVTGRASLEPRDVLGYVFWTRDPRPLGDEVGRIVDEGTPVAFQITVTGYGAELEPRRPPLEEALEGVRWAAQQVAGPRAVQWRYDPIVLCDRYPADFHVEQFAAIAAAIGSLVRVVNVSFVEPYLRAVRRIADPSVCYRPPAAGRHRATQRAVPDLKTLGPEGAQLVRRLAEVAQGHHLELRSCCDGGIELPPSACVGADLFGDWGPEQRDPIEQLARGPSRDGCHCRRSVDIGTPNTCAAGCRYCYVLTSDASARANHAGHRPDQPALGAASQRRA